jgi:hypothetical protein
MLGEQPKKQQHPFSTLRTVTSSPFGALSLDDKKERKTRALSTEAETKKEPGFWDEQFASPSFTNRWAMVVPVRFGIFHLDIYPPTFRLHLPAGVLHAHVHRQPLRVVGYLGVPR